MPGSATIQQMVDAIEGLKADSAKLKARVDAVGKTYVSSRGIVEHVAVVNAFENKFDSFTGVVKNKLTNEVIKERFSTLEQARNFVKTKAYAIFGPVTFASMPRKNEYYANVWKQT